MESQPLITVWLLVPAHSLILDWAGPAEALRMANQALAAQQQSARFALRFVSPTPTALTSVGVNMSGLEPLPTLPLPSPSWVIVVGQPGAEMPVDSPMRKQCCSGCAACTRTRATPNFSVFAPVRCGQHMLGCCMANVPPPTTSTWTN